MQGNSFQAASQAFSSFAAPIGLPTEPEANCLLCSLQPQQYLMLLGAMWFFQTLFQYRQIFTVDELIYAWHRLYLGARRPGDEAHLSITPEAFSTLRTR